MSTIKLINPSASKNRCYMEQIEEYTIHYKLRLHELARQIKIDMNLTRQGHMFSTLHIIDYITGFPVMSYLKLLSFDGSWILSGMTRNVSSPHA